MVSAPRLVVPFLVLATALSLTGCGIGDPALPVPVTGVTLHGVVHGGQSPVDGAVMQLYAVGNGGNGTGATPLIKSTVKSVNGGFTITGDYTCPADINGQGVPVDVYKRQVGNSCSRRKCGFASSHAGVGRGGLYPG